VLEISKRVAGFPWTGIAERLSNEGFSRIGILLTEAECERLRSLYSEPERFRAQIDMSRYRFGRGEYQYFRYPLPELVGLLREELYGCLHETANAWMSALGIDVAFPPKFNTFLKGCRRRGQVRPTPLLLRYRAGDFNCLHQDIYGDVVFPFQVIIGLSSPINDFKGGELLLVEQRPRAQSRGHALTLARGEAVVISTRFRPVRGVRGYYRATLRHGVSTILEGERFTLGIVFHDSK
jgi:uncharacterized protein